MGKLIESDRSHVEDLLAAAEKLKSLQKLIETEHNDIVRLNLNPKGMREVRASLSELLDSIWEATNENDKDLLPYAQDVGLDLASFLKEKMALPESPSVGELQNYSEVLANIRAAEERQT